MFLVAPWLAWLAAITSLVLLVARRLVDDATPGWRMAGLTSWFGAAAYCQFFGRTDIVTAAGLAAQTILAVWLVVRWRFES